MAEQEISLTGVFLMNQKITKPFFLSGGISPGDEGQVRTFGDQHPELFSIDINSRFEMAPGIKNISAVKKFFHGLNGK